MLYPTVSSAIAKSNKNKNGSAMRSLLIVLLSLFALTACDSTRSLKELRRATPVGDAYHTALAAGYQDFAEIKVLRYDWWTSKYFADKGLMAAYGRAVEPEDATNWDIPEAMIPDFHNAREKLMAVVAETKDTQPAQSANAVVLYDRWLELQYNRWNIEKIDEARDAFFAALAKLQEVHVAEPGTNTPSSEPLAELAATPADETKLLPVETTSTILYFPFDSDTLGGSANTALAEMVKYIQNAGNVEVVINGHADRAGTEDYNMALSQRRAQFVMKALEKAGVAAKVMKYFAFGESDPAVPTADGVHEPKNRRVEIFIE